MTEETHKKLNRWLETVERCLRIGAALLLVMTANDPHSVTNAPHHTDPDHVRYPAQS
ncbi:TPA: hypothetical protein QDB15_006415 [Burkholderia vietnamiensis]|uniref:hypothetical protein n=1 Tax=Burkholderia vietnamiensis TaxID=60552 RepID=UPI0015948DD5|nr:hypothetical protein [Burkholderia vietnamiensis]MCA8211983.1 hypothetical protein [Burkholderia vietnamiensis]HDR9102706.1 hypothetical protein [Burkholderia vietnamiensis]HDR9122522.1 hypothetical protein [Burkholderia vietnamiensis]HDR9172284.1 hypothetical protein [Burkholderia vietnamiensis]HDR9284631.1 hypothetical protein [Burkholderia vietnamiensis]